MSGPFGSLEFRLYHRDALGLYARHPSAQSRTRRPAPRRFPHPLSGTPVGKRLRAHGAITPAPAIQARAALKEFQRSQTAVIELPMECRHLDLNRIRFPNPFVPVLRFTAGAGFLLIAATCGRPLWQYRVNDLPALDDRTALVHAAIGRE